jgi:hypothetical protein
MHGLRGMHRMRGLARVAAIALAPCLAGARAHGQVDASSSPPPPLFTSDVPLRLRLAGDLRTLVNDRDSLEATDHPFTLTYQVGDEPPVSLDVKLKTRGHWRRQERHCDFPPLRLDVPRGRAGETLFAEQDKLKLVTPCKPGMRDYVEYILREYLVYRAYNLLTPLSFRARRARTTYVDTTGREDSLTTETFLIEDAAQMAARNDGMLLEVHGAEFDHMDSLQLGLVGVFLYMIGGTDWSLRGLHNMEVVQDPQRGTFYPVTYDFDFTGIVNTAYARPDSRLRVPSVRTRLYRGRCLSEPDWNAVFDRFREQRAAISALYDSLPGLSEGYVKDTRRYLDDFFRVIDDPQRASRELVRRCRAAEGI